MNNMRKTIKIISTITLKEVIVLCTMVVVLLAIDHMVKAYIMSNFVVNYDRIDIFTGLQIIFILNKGVSFSFLNMIDYKFLFLISLLALLLSVVMIINFYSKISLELLFVVSLVISGAVGNLIDRVKYQGVVDYIHIYYGEYSFPVFNLSDCMITLCAIILIKHMLFKKDF